MVACWTIVRVRNENGTDDQTVGRIAGGSVACAPIFDVVPAASVRRSGRCGILPFIREDCGVSFEILSEHTPVVQLRSVYE